MPLFRKRPVEIEARRFEGGEQSAAEMIAWIGPRAWRGTDLELGVVVMIETRERCMMPSPGDWIVKGVQGEFSSCKPDIFAASYDPVEG